MTEPMIFHEKVELYLARLAANGMRPHPVLERMELEGTRRCFPMVGPEVGRFFHQLAQITQPGRILELGSGFGYSAMWWALGARSAQVHLTDWEEKNLDMAREYAGQAGVARRFHCHKGNALEIARKLPGPWDIIFVDIDKTEYPAALRFAERALEPGGIAIFDNILWRGLVAEEEHEMDDAAKAVHSITFDASRSPFWTTSVIPIRDGLLMAVRQNEEGEIFAGDTGNPSN